MTKTETAMVGAALAAGVFVGAPAAVLVLAGLGVWKLWRKKR
jgi:hypothetical protein